MYCNLDIYNNYLRPYLGDEWLNDVPLWLALPVNFVFDQNGYIKDENGKKIPMPLEYFLYDNEPILPKGRKTWTIWQVKFNGDPEYYGFVDKRAVDVDVYNGTVEEMREALGLRKPLPLEEIQRRAKRMLARIK